MKSSAWTGSVMAGSAFAAGLCFYCAASAQADTGDEGPARTPRTSVDAGPSRAATGTAHDTDGTDSKTQTDDSDSSGSDDIDDSDSSGSDDIDDADEIEDVEDDLDDSPIADDELDGDVEDATAVELDPLVTDDAEIDTGVPDTDTPDTDALDAGVDAEFGTTDTTARTTQPEGADVSAAAPASEDPADTYPTVTTALHQLSQAQSLLTAGTWGEGNLFAGIAAIAPQLMIGTAQLSLRQWEDSIDHALGFFAATEGIPIVHGIARVNLAATEFLPTVAQVSLSAAQSLLPAVSQAGASLVALEAYGEIAAAQQNAMVYATVPITTTTTELGQVFTVVNISVNGGGMVPVLLDTGSIGLVIDSSVVPLGSLGPTEDSQDICSQVTSGHCSADYVGADVAFDVYTTTVDFGNGIVTDPTFVGVTVVEGAFDGLPFYGILGVGPNSFGPIVSSPTTALPGLLPTGALINADAGYLTFGPNPLPARVTLPGNPHTEFFLAFDGGAPQLVQLGSIDSGGASGLISPALIPTGGLPPGTTVSLYTVEDGTLIYSYTLDETNTPSPDLDPPANTYFNTGHEAFIHGPVYVDFTANEGNGAASFDLDWWGWRAPSIRLPWL